MEPSTGEHPGAGVMPVDLVGQPELAEEGEEMIVVARVT